MRVSTLALALVVAGCSSSSSSAPPTLYSGQWIYESGAEASGYSFAEGGQYTGVVSVGTSETTANVYKETGVFAQTATQITFTPHESSCTGVYPAYTDQYGFKGDVLLLSSASGTTSYMINPDQVTANVSIVYGCFAADGTFTAHPIAPVSN